MRKSFVCLVLSLVFMLGCGNRQEKNNTTKDGKHVDTSAVKIAVMPTIDCLPLIVAKEHNMFERNGLNIALRRYTAQMDIDTALTGGYVKGAVTDVFRAERLQKKAQLTYATRTESKWYLITNRTARLKRLEQFGDKMIAMTRYSATDYLTDATFKDVKTTAPFFKVQINDVNIRLNMMLNNEMDAAWMEEPQATQAELRGNNRLKTHDTEKYGVIAFRTKYLKKQQKDFIKQFKAAYTEACDSINKYGVQAYSSDFGRYFKVDTSVVNHMPKMVFTHAEAPTQAVIELARKESLKK